MKNGSHCVSDPRTIAAALCVGLCATSALAGDWLDMTNETAARFQAAPSLGSNDQEEKDYAAGDVNNNGWVDLVIVRKQPFSTSGRRVNVLMINEGGVLVDRTEEYASASDVPGDEGFLTQTNDRDVVLHDLINNGWLDLITAPTYGQGQPKHISHPRVYRNLGDSGGSWQGFLYEDARTPQYASPPNNCGVAAGDVTENGFADLYFVTYQDTNDRLLINNSTGFFTEQTAQRLPSSFYSGAAFGTAVRIADLNGNGLNDIIQTRGLPGMVRAVYNQGEGFFGSNTTPPNGATYHLALGDLNNNGRLDLVTVDDGTDRYTRNQSTNANGTVSWSASTMLPESSCGSGSNCSGFGGNAYTHDLNNNGWLDILVADVDVDISGCGRHSNIYRNNANAPNVTFTRDLATIPVSMLQGVFDFGLLDITGNGWADIVVGRCSGTQVWINNPPFDLTIDWPEGRPSVLPVDEPVEVRAQMTPLGGSLIDPTLHTSVNGGAWQEQAMVSLGDDLYAGSLPAVECLDQVEYFVSGQVEDTTFVNPLGAPGNTYVAIAAEDTAVTIENDFDADDAGYTVVNDASLTLGAWSYGSPTGALFGGNVAAPFGDVSGSGMAWVTCLGGPAGACNVDNGPTHLISQTFDLSSGPAEVIYDRWMFCHNADVPLREDFLRTYVSNDGGDTWVFVHQTSGTDGDWETVSFNVADFVAPTDNVVVRFSVMDETNDSISNAGIDNVRIETFVCDDETPCAADLTGDGSVGVSDLLELLGAWGENPGHAADLTGDGTVGVSDLLELLGAWGACPQ